MSNKILQWNCRGIRANYEELLQLLQQICPVSWGCRIHRLLLCSGVRLPPPNECPDMTLNNLIVRFQQCRSFVECRVPLYCHCSQVHWPGVVASDNGRASWWLRLSRVLVLRTKWTDGEPWLRFCQALRCMQSSERIDEARALSCPYLCRRIVDGSYGFVVPDNCVGVSFTVVIALSCQIAVRAYRLRKL